MDYSKMGGVKPGRGNAPKHNPENEKGAAGRKAPRADLLARLKAAGQKHAPKKP